MKYKSDVEFFEEGVRAFLRGQDLEECPYAKNTEEYYNWQDGWIEESSRIADYDRDG